ncbi:hypothetical protein D3C76_1136500 [compost metagenome]
MLVLVEQGGQVNRMLAYLVDIRAADPVLDRPAHRRPHFQGLDEAADTDEVIAQALAQACAQGLTGLEVLGHDHQLRVVGVLQLNVQWQVETDRPLADVTAPAHDFRIALERRLQAIDRLAGLVERSVLRQVQVHEDFRAVGRREKLVLHETHGKQRQRKQQDGQANSGPGIAHAPEQAIVEGLADAPGLLGMGFDVLAEDVHAQHRGEQHRDDP